IKPNMITMFGLSISIVSGFFFWEQRWGLAGWIMIAGGVFDLFDGRVARATSRVTKAGAYLDSVTDRYSDGFILGGLTLAFRDSWLLLPLILCFIGFFSVSYAKARAEASGIKCNVGFFQRPERIFSLGLSAVFSPIISYYFNFEEPVLLYLVITILGVGTVITSAYRIYYSFKRL
ncbi:MAG: CDP-alcohol phosphatidyltransferase family protein, partial [Proteobacteria bacterium]|nr:CDP-alcohol phosphatidyltransferase family protein [Pseudomonadota bacterium]